jgi:hypothetical protein
MGMNLPQLNVWVREMDLTKLRYLDRNARYMAPAKFNRLVENIRRDGVPTSVSFVCREDDGGYRILSGNHRTKATIQAGITHALVMGTDDLLTEDQKWAIQLSHNALAGEDDPEMLKELWNEVATVEWKAYAGLDDAALGTIKPVTVDPLAVPGLDFQTVQLLMLPDERKRAAEILGDLRSTAKDTWLARMAEVDRLFDSLADVNAAYGVKNTATGLMLMLDLVERHLDDLREPWAETERAGWVPLSSIFATRSIPKAAAVVVLAAVTTMVDRGELEATSLWQALERWAADYLAGP